MSGLGAGGGACYKRGMKRHIRLIICCIAG